jgi:hypothetical protein
VACETINPGENGVNGASAIVPAPLIPRKNMFTSNKSDQFNKRGQWLKANPPTIQVSRFNLIFEIRGHEQAEQFEAKLQQMSEKEVRQLHKSFASRPKLSRVGKGA